jgi:hypothetical protein
MDDKVLTALRQRAVAATMRGRANMLNAVAEQSGFEHIIARALAEALHALKEGGSDADATIAAAMSFYASVRETCQPIEDEKGHTHVTLALPDGTHSIVRFLQLMCEQMGLSRIHAVMLLALIDAAGGWLEAETTTEQLAAAAEKHAAAMGIVNFGATKGGAGDGKI